MQNLSYIMFLVKNNLMAIKVSKLKVTNDNLLSIVLKKYTTGQKVFNKPMEDKYKDDS